MEKYFFLHIPKTAGTSLFSYFQEILGRPNVERLWNVNMAVNSQRYTDKTFIGGHFVYRDMLRYFPERNYIFTFIRNPVDRFLSTYFYNKNQVEEKFYDPVVRMAKEMDLTDYIRNIRTRKELKVKSI